MGRTTILLLAISVLTGQAHAASRQSDSITVGATVAPYLRIEPAPMPVEILLQQEDLDRGWIDVPIPGALFLQSNDPYAVRLLFRLEGTAFRAVEVSGGVKTRFGRGGSFVQPALRAGVATAVDLRFRLEIADGTVPGSYPWAVRVDARLVQSPLKPPPGGD